MLESNVRGMCSVAVLGAQDDVRQLCLRGRLDQLSLAISDCANGERDDEDLLAAEGRDRGCPTCQPSGASRYEQCEYEQKNRVTTVGWLDHGAPPAID